MRTLIAFLAATALAALSATSAARSAPSDMANLGRAVADTTRPPTDTARDANRKPLETLAFAGIRSGDKIADYIANSGYFTRLFADAVGPGGFVYAVEPTEIVTFPNVAPAYARLKDWAKTRANVAIMTVPAAQGVVFPQKLDVFWISQNYHDLHDKFLGPLDVAAFNRQVYEALKPGGTYIVLDHVAAKGAPADVTETLHRIEPETVKREVLAAGFELEAESAILRNPGDPHTANVFDKSIAGHTDQFLFKFRRPR